MTISEGHPWPPKVASGRDVGGEFFTKSQFVDHVSFVQHANTKAWYGDTEYTYSGPFVAGYGYGAPSFDYVSGPARNELNALGTTAIARTIPTNPSADVSVFLGELLREGLPSLIGSQFAKSGILTGAAREFLNFEFGIKPVISDVRKIANAVVRSEKILRQLKRDSGRNVRRRYEFAIEPPVVESEGPGYAEAYPNPPLSWTTGPGYRSFGRAYKTSRSWFSGCYTYHFELGDKSQSWLEEHAQKAKYLLGIELTPEVLWNLSPWSWLVDWVSNVGDIFHNVSAFADDGLVLRYGYLMNHFKQVHQANIHNLYVYNGYGNPVLKVGDSLESLYGVEVKQRIQATPYGFGLSLDGFDLRQWAILGALGISRSNSGL